MGPPSISADNKSRVTRNVEIGLWRLQSSCCSKNLHLTKGSNTKQKLLAAALTEESCCKELDINNFKVIVKLYKIYSHTGVYFLFRI